MKRKPLPFFEKVEIVDAGSEGKAIARVGELVVFVPFVVPGDLVDIQVLRKKKNFCEGKAVKIHEYSDKRTEPFCNHFGLCGGCRWQSMAYEHQLFYKQKQVVDAFERIGKLDFPEIRPILASGREQFYRNKLEYTFSARRWLQDGQMHQEPGETEMRGLGFHLPTMFDRIVDIETCYLQPLPSNTIRLALRDFTLKAGFEYWNARNNVGFMRNLLIRNSNTGGLMVIVVFGEDRPDQVHETMDFLAGRFPEITSLMYIINLKKNDTISDQDVLLYKGLPYIEEKMEDLVFRIGPQSFFQTNSEQAYQLYKITRDFAGLTGNETVYDLYTGTGTIAMFVAHQAAKVVGVEYVESAVEDARKNSVLNNISNTVYYSGDMVDVLTPEFIQINGRPDVIITDPPRAGMHEKVVKQILEILPETIVYVSCNPATQARDLALMKDAYTIEAVQPVDMFPHTQHVENVCLMRKK